MEHGLSGQAAHSSTPLAGLSSQNSQSSACIASDLSGIAGVDKNVSASGHLVCCDDAGVCSDSDLIASREDTLFWCFA